MQHCLILRLRTTKFMSNKAKLYEYFWDSPHEVYTYTLRLYVFRLLHVDLCSVCCATRNTDNKVFN